MGVGKTGASFKTGESEDNAVETFHFTCEGGETYVTTGSKSGRNAYSLSADGITLTHQQHAGITATLQPNGDLSWSHGFTSRIVAVDSGAAKDQDQDQEQLNRRIQQAGWDGDAAGVERLLAQKA